MARTKKLTPAEFVLRARVTHGDKYDYANVTFKNVRERVEIGCPEHGIFHQVAYAHYSGQGCNKCGRERQNARTKFNTEIFIEKAKAVHGDRYDYSRVEYLTARKHVEIGCKEHGYWRVVPDSHLRGYDCPRCGDEKTGRSLVHSLDKFLLRAKRIHSDRYDYSLVAYKNARSHVDIICREHGVFRQVPDVHLNRAGGCPRCLDRWKDQNDWLASLGVPDDQQHRQVRLKLSDDSTVIVDGYDPVTKTVYEYWGTYYHGHPEYFSRGRTYYGTEFKELFRRTEVKIAKLKASGYNLVDIWEHDWNPKRFNKE